MTATEYLHQHGIEPRLKDNGKIGLQGINALPPDTRAEVITWARNHREMILQELSPDAKNVFTQKGGDAGLKIEPMNTCLHGKPCRHLKGPGECRPVCSKADMPVFDMDACPLNKWAGNLTN